MFEVRCPSWGEEKISCGLHVLFEAYEQPTISVAPFLYCSLLRRSLTHFQSSFSIAENLASLVRISTQLKVKITKIQTTLSRYLPVREMMKTHLETAKMMG